jgi:hypothetical protein
LAAIPSVLFLLGFCPVFPAFSDKTRLQGKQALTRLENQFENALMEIGYGCISTDRNFLHKKYAAIISQNA